MRFDPVPIIKDRLTMREVIGRYGFETDRKGFICCPFHNEKTASMKIYDTSYYCFGCHASGDVIKFVQTLFNLSFPETLKKIDVDFNLNVLKCNSFEDLRRSHYQQRMLQAKRNKQTQKRESAINDYWNVFDEWKRLTDNKVKYAPKTQDEELHPLFVEALKKNAHQEYLLDCAEIERRECEK
jgi:hypothetical protein